MFEVGAILRIVDEASPALVAILAEIRKLNAAIEKAKLNLASVSKMPSLDAAIAETSKLASTWRNIAGYAERTSRAGVGGGGSGGRLGSTTEEPTPNFSLPGAGIIGNIALAGAGAAFYS